MIKCPVCGQYEFEREDDYDICEVCMWENDQDQMDDPTEEGGANEFCLNEYRAKWEATHHASARKTTYAAAAVAV